MPVFATQWRDGDVTLVSANNIEEAMKVFDETACLEPCDVVELKTAHLSVTLTLGRDGKLQLAEPTPALEEAHALCFPEIVRALGGMPAARTEKVEKLVNAATKIRRLSRLSRKLRKGK